MLNRLDLLRRAAINTSKNLLAFWGVCWFWGFFAAYYIRVRAEEEPLSEACQ